MEFIQIFYINISYHKHKGLFIYANLLIRFFVLFTTHHIYWRLQWRIWIKMLRCYLSSKWQGEDELLSPPCLARLLILFHHDICFICYCSMLAEQGRATGINQSGYQNINCNTVNINIKTLSKWSFWGINNKLWPCLKPRQLHGARVWCGQPIITMLISCEFLLEIKFKNIYFLQVLCFKYDSKFYSKYLCYPSMESLLSRQQ